MAGYLSEKLTDAYDMLKNISTEIVEKRIIAALLKYSEKTGKERSGYRKIDFPLTRQEIAEMVVTTVETCIRMMSKFRKQGVVKYSGNRIYVKTEPLEKALSAY
jgi:CRP/FNR family transcriptional regulator